MKLLHWPQSPLAVVYLTMLVLQLLGVMILFTLLVEWLPASWSRTVIILQGLTLMIAVVAARWRPPRRFILFPILVAIIAYLWDETLPPPSFNTNESHLVPFLIIIVVVIGGDLFLTWWQSQSFTPKRIPVYGKYVNLDEAAHFFNLPPDVLRMHLVQAGHPVSVGRNGEEYAALDQIIPVVTALRSQDRS
ncbi:MAG TPA: hypothetical protein VD886_02075 [Herpetosiphonaceae bacterium]|nr:hypothetical protein [Herpetosiphonaceae bacterium]